MNAMEMPSQKKQLLVIVFLVITAIAVYWLVTARSNQKTNEVDQQDQFAGQNSTENTAPSSSFEALKERFGEAGVPEIPSGATNSGESDKSTNPPSFFDRVSKIAEVFTSPFTDNNEENVPPKKEYTEEELFHMIYSDDTLQGFKDQLALDIAMGDLPESARINEFKGEADVIEYFRLYFEVYIKHFPSSPEEEERLRTIVTVNLPKIIEREKNRIRGAEPYSLENGLNNMKAQLASAFKKPPFLMLTSFFAQDAYALGTWVRWPQTSLTPDTGCYKYSGGAGAPTGMLSGAKMGLVAPCCNCGRAPGFRGCTTPRPDFAPTDCQEFSVACCPNRRFGCLNAPQFCGTWENAIWDQESGECGCG